MYRRRLHGRRGLKYERYNVGDGLAGRRLHGRRGLKWRGKVEEESNAYVAAFTGGVD